MSKITALVALMALGACVPIIVSVPVVAPQQVRAISAQAPTDVLFDQYLADCRQKAGVNPLAFNTQLAKAATAHAKDMNARGYFDHTSPEGASAGDRAAAFGVPACGIGENIARGQKTSPEAFESWALSGPHRRNLLNPLMAGYGIGNDGDTWVMLLYAPC